MRFRALMWNGYEKSKEAAMDEFKTKITVSLTIRAVSLNTAEEKLDAVERAIRRQLTDVFERYGIAEYRTVIEPPCQE